MTCLQSYYTLTFCGVCDVLLVGLTRQGYRCELCGLDVHGQCQLQANLQRPCPGAPAKNGGDGSKAGKKNEAPAKDGNGKEGAVVTAKEAEGGVEGERVEGQAGAKPKRPGAEAGIGIMKVTVLDAHRCSAKCAEKQQQYQQQALALTAGATEQEQLQPPPAAALHCFDELEGDHYCRVKLGEKLSRRTRTVYQTANPRFEESWRLIAPYYRAVLGVEMIDAVREKAVGRLELSVFQLLQRDADAQAEGGEVREVEEYVLRDGSEREVGFVRMRIAMEEDMQVSCDVGFTV